MHAKPFYCSMIRFQCRTVFSFFLVVSCLLVAVSALPETCIEEGRIRRECCWQVESFMPVNTSHSFIHTESGDVDASYCRNASRSEQCVWSFDILMSCLLRDPRSCCSSVGTFLSSCDESGKGKGYFTENLSTDIRFVVDSMQAVLLDNIERFCPSLHFSCLKKSQQRRSCLFEERQFETDRPSWVFSKGESRCCNSTMEYLQVCSGDASSGLAWDFAQAVLGYGAKCSAAENRCSQAEREREKCIRDIGSSKESANASACCWAVEEQLAACSEMIDDYFLSVLPENVPNTEEIESWEREAEKLGIGMIGKTNMTKAIGVLQYEAHRNCTEGGLACELSKRSLSQCSGSCCNDLISVKEDCKYERILVAPGFLEEVESLIHKNCTGPACYQSCKATGLVQSMAQIVEETVCPLVYRYELDNGTTCFGNVECFSASIPLQSLLLYSNFLKKLDRNETLSIVETFVDATEPSRVQERLSSGMSSWSTAVPSLVIHGCGGGLVCPGPIPHGSDSQVLYPGVLHGRFGAVLDDPRRSSIPAMNAKCCASPKCNPVCPTISFSKSNISVVVGENVEVSVSSTYGSVVRDGIVTRYVIAVFVFFLQLIMINSKGAETQTHGQLKQISSHLQVSLDGLPLAWIMGWQLSFVSSLMRIRVWCLRLRVIAFW
mmetsp:Transcript_50630/g.130552  ORF Transcript_50630/g.130552 Transcript_50630/m.130552 type:complete len:663 (-) Transcript_50630:968-2956(-)